MYIDDETFTIIYFLATMVFALWVAQNSVTKKGDDNND